MGDIGRSAQAIASVGDAVIGANASKYAADQQAQSAKYGIDVQNSQFNKTQENEAPWLAAGRTALDQLTAGTAPGGSLVTPFGETYQTPAAFDGGPAFTAPTLDNTNDPGYAFRLQQGQQAIERGAAASGGAFSGGTLKALTRYGQDYASNEYGNVYNRALQGYQTNFADRLNAYNTNTATGLQGYQTRFNAYQTNQGNQYNRLAALSGTGQTAVGQLAQAGQANANAVSDLATQAGNARAAGALGIAGSINNGVQNGINNYQSGQLISALTGGSGGGGAGYRAPANNWYGEGGGNEATGLPGGQYQSGDDGY